LEVLVDIVVHFDGAGFAGNVHPLFFARSVGHGVLP
jgi:hypothetical protein